MRDLIQLIEWLIESLDDDGVPEMPLPVQEAIEAHKDVMKWMPLT